MGRAFWLVIAFSACLIVLAGVVLACRRVSVKDTRTFPFTSDGSKTYYSSQEYLRAPTDSEFAVRLVWCIPLSILVTLCAVYIAAISFRKLPIEMLAKMTPRYTIRHMLLLVLLVALAVGWISDHRREEQVIKLMEDREMRQDKLISDLQDDFHRISGLLHGPRRVPDTQP